MRKVVPIAVFASFALGTSSASAQAPAADLERFDNLERARACAVIDFEEAHLVGGFAGGWYVYAEGTKPWITMKVMLVPLVYVDQPEYWEIEVVGCLSGIGLPALAPYTTDLLDLNGIIGTRGVEIVGANGTERIDIPAP